EDPDPGILRVHWSVKAPAATSCGHIRFMAGHGGTIGCGPAWTVCATSSAKRQPSAQEERRDELWHHGQSSQVDDDAP
ncbi:MAG: hypothetical protein KAI41_13155, partial [Hyphomicrobiaceae bacterium]|nr:hypothetical protein [Hyphomicrobiaceae bacterium]